MEITKNKKRVILVCLLLLTLFFTFAINCEQVYATGGGTLSTKEGFMGSFQNFYNEYKGILNGIIGIGLLTNIGIFIFHFCKLSSVSANPQKRAEVINNLLITGLCTALLGAVPILAVILVKTTQ